MTPLFAKCIFIKLELTNNYFSFFVEIIKVVINPPHSTVAPIAKYVIAVAVIIKLPPLHH